MEIARQGEHNCVRLKRAFGRQQGREPVIFFFKKGLHWQGEQRAGPELWVNMAMPLQISHVSPGYLGR